MIELDTLWESTERILIKVIGTSEYDETSGEVVVIGLAMSGVGCYRRPVGDGSTLQIEIEYLDISSKLSETAIGDLKDAANKCSRSSQDKYIQFIDPTPWIDELSPLPLETDIARRLRAQERQRQEELAGQKNEHERAKKAAEKKKKRSLWNWLFR